MTRVDIRRMVHDVRYLHLDCGTGYLVWTDDFRALPGVPPEVLHKTVDEIAKYQELFSTLVSLIYLPATFVALGSKTTESSFPTELSSRESEDFVKKAVREVGESSLVFTRSVQCLYTEDSNECAAELSITPPELKFACSGYWQALVPGQVGVDEEGKQVIGRTWVSRHETWSADSPRMFLLKKPLRQLGKDPGWIYIVRSPSHDMDLYKVGLTRRTTDKRAADLSRHSGVALPFAVLASWEVDDCSAVEREAHMRLASRRVNPRREFFHGQLSEIINTINQIVSGRCIINSHHKI